MTRCLDVALLFLAILILGLSLVPISPSFHQHTVDSGWIPALHYTAIHRLAWGREIAFTTGPLGFLYAEMFSPGTYPLVLAYWALMAALTSASVMSLARGLRWSDPSGGCGSEPGCERRQ